MTPVRRTVDWVKANPFRADALLALLLAGLALPGPFLDPHTTIHFRDPDALAVILVLLGSLPIAWRRLYPVTVLIVAGVPAVLYEALGYRPGNLGGIGALIACYTIAAHCKRRTVVVAAAFTSGCIIAILLTARWDANALAVASQF